MVNKHPFMKDLSLPAVAAPMFLISSPKLVIETCKTGIIGTFPALNNRTTAGFDQWLTEIETALEGYTQANGKPAAPYGVNLTVHRTNPRLKADLQICVKHKVPIVITSLGAANEVIDTIHSYGGLVFHDVINIRHAYKAANAGVDGLICVTAGAGGHAGTLHPMPFVQEVRNIFDGTILLSGCLSTGSDIASAMQMGADLAYMGTRFINVAESAADEAYRNMIIAAGTKDIVYTAAISGVNGNFLRSSLEAMGITKEMWSMKAKVNFKKELDADKAETKAWKTVWSAGQGVATIKDSMPVAELVKRLKEEFIAAIKKQQQLLETYG